MATCQKCGRTIDDGEKYCPSCKETRDQKKKGFFKIIGTAAVLIVGVIASCIWKKKTEE